LDRSCEASIRPYLCAGYFGGETSIGHSFVGGGDYPEVDKVEIGFADLAIENGKYRIKKIYTGESWNLI
jgi:tricorn protease